MRGGRDLEIEARDTIIIGMAQRLWQCDIGLVEDAVRLLYDAELAEDEMYDPAIIAACEIVAEKGKVPGAR